MHSIVPAIVTEIRALPGRYLEEEAVRTYTHALKDLDAGNLPTGRPLQRRILPSAIGV